MTIESENRAFRSNLVDIETTLNEDIEIAYDIIVAWIEQNKIKIKKQAKPHLIEAKHGTSFTLSRKPHIWTKNFTFLLNEVEEGTVVRMIINPPWHDRYQSNANETARSWLEFTNKLWEDQGINPQNIYPQEIYNPKTIVNELHKLWRNIYLGIIAGSIIFTYGLIDSLFHLPELEILDFVGYMGFFSAMMSYFGVGPTKKRLSLLGIDLGSNNNPYRPLKFLTLFVVISSVASVNWVWNLDPYTTYSDYGFSFTRNRWWELKLSGWVNQEPDDLQGSLVLTTEEAAFGLFWASLDYVRENITIEGELDIIINSLLEGFDERNISYVHNVWERTTLNIHGHEMAFQNGSIPHGEKTWYYVYGVFICDVSNRFFTVHYLVERDFHLRYLDVMLEDFMCH